MKVLKFGGTSVGTPDSIRQAIRIIEKEMASGPVCVVVSAFSGVTDLLIEISKKAAQTNPIYQSNLAAIKKRHETAINELCKDPAKTKQLFTQIFEELEKLVTGITLLREATTRTLDLIMSFGERFSAFIISQAMSKADYLDARHLVKTDDNFGNATLDSTQTEKNIREFFKTSKKLQIITGFIGSTENNETTTLGRGGSDYTASIFGAALKAKEILIYTDVDGIFTADPKKVKRVFCIPAITFKEALELSHFGAKVIYPSTMQPAMQYNLPIRIKNTFNPEAPGTLISSETTPSDFAIRGISSISNIALLRLEGSGLIGVAGIAQRLFGTLAKDKISVILITQASSEHSICFAIEPAFAEKAKRLVDDEFSLEIHAKRIEPIIIENDLSIIAVVGENMRRSVGISGKFFQSLGKNGVNIIAIAQGSSELNISAVISKKDEAKAINAIHDSFFLSDIKCINLYLAGAGQIGSALLHQIEKQAENLRKYQNLEIKLIAICNSRKMVIKNEGINLTEFTSLLKNSKTKMDPNLFLNEMFSFNLPNSVFVDCTTSEEIALYYEKILKSSISVVTPNKKACSGPLKLYKLLKQTAKRGNVKFLYETNVGAGLPVINTLNDLLNSGDKINTIQGVFSGTLSFIFNSMNDGISFSEAVEKAVKNGYTEPDPRDDLNGKDVARKILILARETGLDYELNEVSVENLVPEELRKGALTKDFISRLKKYDPLITEKMEKARKENSKLCYIASIKDGKIKVALETVNPSHPFYSLSGSDNIISFSTNRYSTRPLVVKGPGAGAEVTAAGVFADILRTSSYLG